MRRCESVQPGCIAKRQLREINNNRVSLRFADQPHDLGLKYQSRRKVQLTRDPHSHTTI
jgi:hypothetical protein